MKITKMKENELISGMISGKEAAYTDAHEIYNKLMLLRARSLVGELNAEEVVQESWICIVKALAKFERRSSLKTWIMAIVSNTAKNQIRKHQHSPLYKASKIEDLLNNTNEKICHRSSPKTNNLWHLSSPDEMLTNEELKNIIYKKINQLPKTQKDVVKFRCLQGLNIDETSKKMKKSSSNVRVLLYRARQSIDIEINRYAVA